MQKYIIMKASFLYKISNLIYFIILFASVFISIEMNISVFRDILDNLYRVLAIYFLYFKHNTILYCMN